MNWKNWFKSNCWLIGILIFAAALRFYHADFQSLWLDEVLSMNDANPKLTFRQFYDSVLFWESFPHLYFLLLKFALAIFGYTSLVARILSAIIGIFGVYAMYLLGRELYSKRAGLIAAGLTAVNIFHLSHSQEVRSYGMLFLFTVLAFYRLAVLIRKPSYKNAIFFGIFSGLTINAHFFGFTALFAQYLLLLFFLIKYPPDLRKHFFICSFLAGVITLIFILPTYDAIQALLKIESFWVPKPANDSFTIMFKEFFGNSELIIYAINILVIYYFLKVFGEKLQNNSHSEIITNKVIFNFIILLVWIVVSVVIPLVKSYLDVSVILIRYFTNVLAVLILVIAIAIDLIKSKMIKYCVIAVVLVFSLVDIFVVKDYYNAPSKTQYRELCNEIINKNPDNAKIIVHWGWIFPYFFQNNPNVKLENKDFPDHIESMRNKSTPIKSFWYADANSRPYNLTPADEAYLNENFVMREKLEYFDAWARFYVAKNEAETTSDKLDFKSFTPVSFDDNGNILIFNNANARSALFHLQKGKYDLVIKGNSLPAKPINNENAHLKVRVNGAIIGDYFMSENPAGEEKVFSFDTDADKNARVQLIYDNDVLVNGQDRNVIIYSIDVRKK
jgi:hypothetical protein